MGLLQAWSVFILGEVTRGLRKKPPQYSSLSSPDGDSGSAKRTQTQTAEEKAVVKKFGLLLRSDI